MTALLLTVLETGPVRVPNAFSSPDVFVSLILGNSCTLTAFLPVSSRPLQLGKPRSGPPVTWNGQQPSHSIAGHCPLAKVGGSRARPSAAGQTTGPAAARTSKLNQQPRAPASAPAFGSSPRRSRLPACRGPHQSSRHTRTRRMDSNRVARERIFGLCAPRSSRVFPSH